MSSGMTALAYIIAAALQGQNTASSESGGSGNSGTINLPKAEVYIGDSYIMTIQKDGLLTGINYVAQADLSAAAGEAQVYAAILLRNNVPIAELTGKVNVPFMTETTITSAILQLTWKWEGAISVQTNDQIFIQKTISGAGNSYLSETTTIELL